jgi:hypothetical protein
MSPEWPSITSRSQVPIPTKDPNPRLLYNHLRAASNQESDREKIRCDHVGWEVTASFLFSGKFKIPNLCFYSGKARETLGKWFWS